MSATKNESISKIDQTAEMLETSLLAVGLSVAETLAEEDVSPKLTSQKSTQERIALQIQNECKQVITRCKRAITKLVEMHMIDDIEKLIDLASIAANSPERIINAINEEKTLQNIVSISDASLDKMYVAATNLYEQGKHSDSADIFYLLTFLKSTSFAPWLGLAHAEYTQKHYKEALYAYDYASQLNPNDHACHMFSAACYLALGDEDKAYHELDIATTLLQNQLTFKELSASLEKQKNRLRKNKR